MLKRRTIPKTEQLIIFEAVARHGNYVSAAQELALTQSAIFRQIKSLEDFLQIKLFDRYKKKLILNEAGQYYLILTKDTLNKLERDVSAIESLKQSTARIDIAINPTLGTHWLIPALADFNAKHKNISVNIHTLSCVKDLSRRNYDLFIMREDFGNHYSNVEYLFKEELFPVCSRSLYPLTGSELSPEELTSNYILLHQNTRLSDWKEWFTASGIRPSITHRGPCFDLLSMLIAAVRANLGVALLPKFAVRKELDNGDMVIPCHIPIREKNYFIMTYENDKKEYPPLRAFREWLLQIVR